MQGVKSSKVLCLNKMDIGGAQIYANHQRIWLGTFKSERDAAIVPWLTTAPPLSSEAEKAIETLHGITK